MTERTPAQLEATAKMLEAKAKKPGASTKAKAAAKKARSKANAAFKHADPKARAKATRTAKPRPKKPRKRKAAPKPRKRKRKAAPKKRKTRTPEERVKDRLLALDVLEYAPGDLKEAPRASGLSVRLIGNVYPVKEEFKRLGFQFADAYWFMGYRAIGGKRQSVGSTSKIKTLDNAFDYLELAEEAVRQYNNRMLSRLGPNTGLEKLDRESNPSKSKSKSSLKVETIKSRHGEAYKFKVTGGGLRATTTQYIRGLDPLERRTASRITPTVNRTDAHKKPPATYNMKKRVIDAVFEAMQALEPRRENPAQRKTLTQWRQEYGHLEAPPKVKPGDMLTIESWTPGGPKTSRRKAKRVTKTFVELHDGTKFRLKETQEHSAFTEIDNSTWQASPDRIVAVNTKRLL